MSFSPESGVYRDKPWVCPLMCHESFDGGRIVKGLRAAARPHDRSLTAGG